MPFRDLPVKDLPDDGSVGDVHAIREVRSGEILPHRKHGQPPAPRVRKPHRRRWRRHHGSALDHLLFDDGWLGRRTSTGATVAATLGLVEERRPSTDDADPERRERPNQRLGTGPDDARDADRLADFIRLGSEMGGGATGAGVGFVLGGPVGALLGGSLGPPIAAALRTAADFAHRQLSGREQVRVVTVVAAAAASIDAGREAGRTFRTDGFFDTTPGDRAAAEEVAEAVLRAAQDEPEERKLPYLARLLSEIAFRPNVDRATASMLVRIGHELTYRQLLLLSLYARKDLFPFPPGNFRDKGLRHMDAVVPLLHDSMDLHARGLVAITGGFALGRAVDARAVERARQVREPRRWRGPVRQHRPSSPRGRRRCGPRASPLTRPGVPVKGEASVGPGRTVGSVAAAGQR